MKINKTEFDTWKVIVLIIVLVAVLVMAVFLLSRVRVDFNVECNSGNIGLNYSHSYFNETSLDNYIKINGINDLNCKVNGKIDAPWWMVIGI